MMNALANRLIFLLLFLAACASPEPVPAPRPDPAAQASIEAKQVAAQAGKAEVTEVRFARGMAALSATESAKLDRAIDEAAKKGEIEQVTLVVWSDKEMPDSERKRLPKADVELADRRAETLSHYFEDRKPAIDADVVNMARRAGPIREFLKTEDARVQETLRAAGVPVDGKPNRSAAPKASRAIVVLDLKEKK